VSASTSTTSSRSTSRSRWKPSSGRA
jgi:hypothetical protein